MWKISKEFDFCYGHRVWTQELNKEYSLDDCLMCRHLHGHQGKVQIEARSESLDNSMVTDFKHFNWFKGFIDGWIDHKFLLDINDPLLPTLLSKFLLSDWIFDKRGFYFLDKQMLQNESSEIVELYEGFILVDFVPTSENLSRWFYEIVQKRMKPLGVQIEQVSFLETPKTKATYIGE